MLLWSVGHLTHLKTLNLADNALRGALPPEISFLRYLRTLDVSSNMLSRRAQLTCFFSPLALLVQKCQC